MADPTTPGTPLSEIETLPLIAKTFERFISGMNGAQLFNIVCNIGA